MAKRTWTFPAKFRRVIDGDTIEMVIDLGFYIEHRIRVRVLDLYAPEVRGEERPQGLAAKALAEQWFAESDQDSEWPFFVTTAKGRSFNRWVGSIERADTEEDFCEFMTQGGFNNI